MRLDATQTPARYVVPANSPLIGIQAPAYGNGASGGQVFPEAEVRLEPAADPELDQEGVAVRDEVDRPGPMAQGLGHKIPAQGEPTRIRAKVRRGNDPVDGPRHLRAGAPGPGELRICRRCGQLAGPTPPARRR